MVVYNYSGKEINAKIVYYGPALSGKTTNLEWIYSKIPVEYSGKMVSLRTQADRTIFFDFLPLDLGMIDGFRTRFMLYTVPGQVHYNATRKMVLKGVDGLVFVADSEPGRMKENIESLQNLRDNLTELGLNFDAMPLVIQWNKRDLPHCMTVAELETQLNPRALPTFEACALTGEGVYETLHKVCRSIYTKLTGNQTGEGEPSLFGDSIAQCLQDVDVPQPEPERVAIGSEQVRVNRGHDDPLGAILGRSDAVRAFARGTGSGAALPTLDTPTTEIRPVAAVDTIDRAVTTGESGPVSSVLRGRGNGHAESGDLAEAERLGGLVDEVLSSLVDHDDVASIDRASSRPVHPSGSAGSALGERLDHFFDGIEPTKPVTVIRADDASVPVTSPWERSDMGFESRPVGNPAPSPRPATHPTVEEILGQADPAEPVAPAPLDPSGMPIEHDVDVFESLGLSGSSSATPVASPGAEADELDLDVVLQEDQSGAQDLVLITDPRKLPRESPGNSTGAPQAFPARESGSFGAAPIGAISRVLEVPVRLDGALVRQGGPLRIVLNITIED